MIAWFDIAVRMAAPGRPMRKATLEPLSFVTSSTLIC